MSQFGIPTTSYVEQSRSWPQSGRHILAHFNDDTIIVYQAYRPEIGHFAAKHGYFGGEFKYSRMSWIKPNFLWMMYRSDWAGQTDRRSSLRSVSDENSSTRCWSRQSRLRSHRPSSLTTTNGNPP